MKILEHCKYRNSFRDNKCKVNISVRSLVVENVAIYQKAKIMFTYVILTKTKLSLNPAKLASELTVSMTNQNGRNGN